MKKLKNFWRKKKVLITGHTGFKGSWLCMVLLQLGADICGYSLKPEKKSLFQISKLNKKIKKNIYGDINNSKKLKQVIKNFKPDIIFHLAAQSLVLNSYQNPVKTFKVNTFGTLNLLEIVNKIKKRGSIIIITSDKVYDDFVKKKYTEQDRIGSTDPYGTSKACKELIANLYQKRVFNTKKYFNITTARSGNVIGGGDFSKNRILPDYFKSKKKKEIMTIRNPEQIRPWLFVLEPLFGYLLLAEKVFKRKISFENIGWNFAPNKKNEIKVINLIKKINILSDKKIKFKVKKSNFKETDKLTLSSKKSEKYLKWKSIYSVDQALNEIIYWYKNYEKKDNMLALCNKQIKKYFRQLNEKNLLR